MPSGPNGIILHYTAGNSFKGSVDWLCRPSFNTKAGAHVVIARGREAWADKAVIKGGIVDSLPTSVVQIRLPSQTAWHSTWANEWAIGIELASCGEIRKNAQGVWVGPNGDWSEKVSDTSTMYEAGERTWQGFTEAQMRTAIRVMQFYQALFPNISPENVVGHENVQGVRTPERLGCDKRDLGIAVDWWGIKGAVFLGKEWSGNGRRSLLMDGLARSLYDDMMKRSSMDQKALEHDAQDALQELGYSTHEAPPGVMPFAPIMATNRRSLYMAQRMLGLVPDMVVGPKTLDALAWRIKDRWGLS